ncbi:clathrin light chain B isoform X1 [Megalops cyprinoides]|uniref:clathrin light chain B isoform X1 n=1 Tax=Megalops cyprinoides TaxID=118141 RepID=UPI001864EECC|nr:clathrin light chain B isoform X1 [Megalops cyprinoides]
MADDFGFFSSSDNGAPPGEDDPAAAFLAQQESEIAGIENDEGFGALEGAGQPQENHSPPQSNYDAFGGEPATVNGDLFQVETSRESEEHGLADTPTLSLATLIDSSPGGEPISNEAYTEQAPPSPLELQESNGPTDAYASIARADQLRQEPESLRKWREEQKARLEELDSASKAAEAEWRERAKKELEDWHVHQNEQMEKNKANNRIADKAFYEQPNADAIGYVASEEAFLKECDEDAPGSEWERVARLCDFNPKTSKQSKDVSRMRSVLISLKQTPLVR